MKTPPSLAFLHFWKMDLERIWPFLVLWILLLCHAYWQALHRITDVEHGSGPGGFFHVLAGWGIAILILRSTPPERRAFWRARPVSASSMLATKLGLILVVLALPPALLDSVAVLWLGFGPDLALSNALEGILAFGAFAVIGSAIAALFPEPKNLASGLLGLVFFFLISIFIRSHGILGYGPDHRSGFMIPGLVLASVFSLSILVALYLHWTPRRRLIAIGLAPVVISIGYPWATWEAIEPKPDPKATEARGEPIEGARAGLEPEPTLELRPRRTSSFHCYQGRKRRAVGIGADIGWRHFDPNLGYQIRLLGGRLEVEGESIWQSDFTEERLIERISAPDNSDPFVQRTRPRAFYSKPTLIVPDSVLGAYDASSTATLEVELRMTVFGTSPFASLEAEPGNQVEVDGAVYRMERIARKGDELDVQITRLTLSSLWDPVDRYSYQDERPGLTKALWIPSWLPARQVRGRERDAASWTTYAQGPNPDWSDVQAVSPLGRVQRLSSRVVPFVRDPDLPGPPSMPAQIELRRKKAPVTWPVSLRLEDVELQSLAIKTYCRKRSRPSSDSPRQQIGGAP